MGSAIRTCVDIVMLVTQLRISEAARLLGVSDDTLRRYVDSGRLSVTLDDAGRKVVAGAELAATICALVPQAPATPDDAHRSARNHFTGLVTHIVSDAVMSQVELVCGPHRVVSLISTEAVGELGLQVGSVATAVVKATNVSIETPRGTR